MSRMRGGSFKSGFLSTAVTQSLSPNFSKGALGRATTGVRVAVAAVVGGSMSVIGGGKFANGAISGSFSRMFNDELAHSRDQDRSGTWDPVTDRRIGELDPRFQPVATEFINTVENETGIQLRVTAGYRSVAEQDALYAIGRTKLGSIITNARGGESIHNSGLAVDVVQMQNGRPNWAMSNRSWESVGQIGERLGMQWGGRWTGFVDRPHFQWSPP